MRNRSIHLSEYLPKSLDDIIRTHRDQCRLALATEAEVINLSQPLARGPVTHQLMRWQIVALHFSVNGTTAETYHLVGRVRGSGVSWMTSKVVAMDLQQKRVRTQRSTYGLWGKPGQEQDIDLHHVCATLNYWGMGPHFGVPALLL